MAPHLQDGRHRAVSALRLCRAEEVPEGGGRDFTLGEGALRRAVLLVRRHGALIAYDNACPHMGTPLNFLPNRFFDASGRHLLCTTHGALFRIEDGFCLRGPCAGKSLGKLALRVVDGEVFLA